MENMTMKGRTMEEWNNNEYNMWQCRVHALGSILEHLTRRGVHTCYSLDGDFHGDGVIREYCGLPWGFSGKPAPIPAGTLPINPRVFWSKQVQKHDFWTRNEGDMTDLHLHKSTISHSVLIQKLCFWTRLTCTRTRAYPYLWPVWV